MRIGIDLRPLQFDAYKERGIGRHLRSWIHAAQRLDTNFEFQLLYDPQLPAPRLNITTSQWQMLPLTLPFSSTTTPHTALHMDQTDEFLFDSASESFFLEHKIDLFHTTYSFMWECFVPRRIFHTRTIVTFYDLISHLFPEHYLDSYGERGKRSFTQRLGAVVYAQRCQTISQSTKNDLINVTKTSPSQIDVIYGGVDEAFMPLPTQKVWQSLKELGINSPYIFSVSGFHYTKNLRRLLEAYHLLSKKLQQQYRLVIRSPLSHEARQTVEDWLDELGIRKQTILLEHVSQEQLVALYNGASLVVHPTLYEGLGLPVLEAMRCGTPVVTSNTSSMPEIAGEAALLVNPYKSADIARQITEVIQSSNLQSKMRTLGLKQAQKFTWERTANAILESYRNTGKEALYTLKRVFPAVIGTRKRLRLAFWTPLNPRPSGISDYSECLISELGKDADLDLFVDGYQPSNLALFDSFPVFDAKAYPYLAHKRPYDINIYQVGNNPLHSYMYDPILKSPGIITLHDIYIYHFIHAVFMLNNRYEEFWQEVAYCDGQKKARSAKIDYFKGKLNDYSLSLNKRVIQRSHGVVTHSQWAKQQVEQCEGAPLVCQIPLGTVILEEDNGKFGKLIRRFLGLPENDFVFGVFGNIHKVKRISAILHAFSRVRQQYPKAALFILGAVDRSAVPILQPYLEEPEIARAAGIYPYLTYVDHVLFLMAMQAVDVGLNLRYPTVGETSSTLSMLLGQGKPTIVSNVGSYVEYPDACCPKTPVNEDEEEILYQNMIRLINDNHAYRKASIAAYEYSRDKSWYHSAQSYLNFIEKVLGRHPLNL